MHSEVVLHPGRKDVQATYEPAIRFSYAIDGKKYKSSTVVPDRVDGEHGWAEELVRNHPAGRITTAYYDPADPSAAFLIKQYVCDPYLFMACAGLFAAFALVFPAAFLWPRPRIRMSAALLGLVALELPVVVASMHYIKHVSPQHPQAKLWIYAGMGLGVIPRLFAVRWWWLDPKEIKAKKERSQHADEV